MNNKKIISSKEIKNVVKCMESNWISYTGKYVSKFEKKFENYLGEGFAVSTCNGTASLILALNTFNISKDDEVIIPNFAFAASINAVISVGAKPVVLDISLKDWLIDINEIKKNINKKTKAIIIVHSYGIVFDVKKLKNFFKKKNIFIIEDSAEALGSKFKNRPLGLLGDCSSYSFYPNKNITTGEGGMVVFKNKNKFLKAQIIRNQGRNLKDKFFNHIYPGNNFRMSNINASIGVAQLSRFNKLQNLRKEIFKNYDQYLKENLLNFFSLPNNKDTENSLWLYTVRLIGISKNTRDKLIIDLINKNIQVRPGFTPLHRQKAYKKYCKFNYKNSTVISNEIISFPTDPFLKVSKIKNICKFFINSLKSFNANRYIRKN